MAHSVGRALHQVRPDSCVVQPDTEPRPIRHLNGPLLEPLGRRPGALLAAAGMQGEWDKIPPYHLYHIIRALHDVGLDAEARMIAAEALVRV